MSRLKGPIQVDEENTPKELVGEASRATFVDLSRVLGPNPPGSVGCSGTTGPV